MQVNVSCSPHGGNMQSVGSRARLVDSQPSFSFGEREKAKEKQPDGCTWGAAPRGQRGASLASLCSLSLSVSCVILSRSLLSLFAACHHLVKEIFIIPERLAVRHHRLSGTLHQTPQNWVRHKYRGQPKVALMPYVFSYPPPSTHTYTFYR